MEGGGSGRMRGWVRRCAIWAFPGPNEPQSESSGWSEKVNRLVMQGRRVCEREAGLVWWWWVCRGIVRGLPVSYINAHPRMHFEII